MLVLAGGLTIGLATLAGAALLVIAALLLPLGHLRS
jgi:hypothetical protein